MQEADIFKVGRRRYLVAPLSPELIYVLIQAEGAEEDDPTENNGDAEPSLAGINAGWSSGVDDADRESDDIDDEAGLGGGDAPLGWANEGTQLHFGIYCPDEDEEHLGWTNTRVQLRLVAAGGGDGDCDNEDDDPGGDPLDADELDPCDFWRTGRSGIIATGAARVGRRAERPGSYTGVPRRPSPVGAA